MTKGELELWLFNLCRDNNIVISDVSVDYIGGKIYIRGHEDGGQLILKQ